ncbi:hypothetical protein FQZ97_981380 [compost metagenome]
MSCGFASRITKEYSSRLSRAWTKATRGDVTHAPAPATMSSKCSVLWLLRLLLWPMKEMVTSCFSASVCMYASRRLTEASSFGL